MGEHLGGFVNIYVSESGERCEGVPQIFGFQVGRCNIMTSICVCVQNYALFFSMGEATVRCPTSIALATRHLPDPPAARGHVRP